MMTATFSESVNDAIHLYKLINATDDYNITPAQLFLSALESLNSITISRITFYTDAVKAIIIYSQIEFTIDYDFEEPESVFISTFRDNILIIKDAHINNISDILKSF